MPSMKITNKNSQILITTLLTLMGCGQDVVVEPKPICGDGVCAFEQGEEPGDAYTGCASDCGPRRWNTPDPDTQPLSGLRLFSAGGDEVAWPSPLETHMSCGPLTGGWSSGYFPQFTEHHVALPYWTPASGCMPTRSPDDYEGASWSLDFELLATGRYDINIWVPKLDESCSSAYAAQASMAARVYPNHLYGALIVRGEDEEQRVLSLKFPVRGLYAQEGSPRAILTNTSLPAGNHTLHIYDTSDEVEACPAAPSKWTQQWPHPRVFADAITLQYRGR